MLLVFLSFFLDIKDFFFLFFFLINIFSIFYFIFLQKIKLAIEFFLFLFFMQQVSGFRSSFLLICFFFLLRKKRNRFFCVCCISSLGDILLNVLHSSWLTEMGGRRMWRHCWNSVRSVIIHVEVLVVHFIQLHTLEIYLITQNT